MWCSIWRVGRFPVRSNLSRLWPAFGRAAGREEGLITSIDTPRERMAWNIFHDVVKRSELEMKKFDPLYSLPTGMAGHNASVI